MSKLVEYLNAVDSDAALSEAFQSDPEAAMADYGLTTEESEAVMTGDKEKVASVAGVEVAAIGTVQSLHTDSGS
jgi:hypothetical protein